MVTLAQMVPSTPKSAKYIDLSFYVGMIHCEAAAKGQALSKLLLKEVKDERRRPWTLRENGL